MLDKLRAYPELETWCKEVENAMRGPVSLKTREYLEMGLRCAQARMKLKRLPYDTLAEGLDIISKLK